MPCRPVHNTLAHPVIFAGVLVRTNKIYKQVGRPNTEMNSEVVERSVSSGPVGTRTRPPRTRRKAGTTNLSWLTRSISKSARTQPPAYVPLPPLCFAWPDRRTPPPDPPVTPSSPPRVSLHSSFVYALCKTFTQGNSDQIRSHFGGNLEVKKKNNGCIGTVGA